MNSHLLGCILSSVPLPNIIRSPSVTQPLTPLQIPNANFLVLGDIRALEFLSNRTFQ